MNVCKLIFYSSILLLYVVPNKCCLTLSQKLYQYKPQAQQNIVDVIKWVKFLYG